MTVPQMGTNMTTKNVIAQILILSFCLSSGILLVRAKMAKNATSRVAGRAVDFDSNWTGEVGCLGCFKDIAPSGLCAFHDLYKTRPLLITGNAKTDVVCAALADVYQNAVSPSATSDQQIKEIYSLLTGKTGSQRLPTLGFQIFSTGEVAQMMNERSFQNLSDGKTVFLSSPDSTQRVRETKIGKSGKQPVKKWKSATDKSALSSSNSSLARVLRPENVRFTGKELWIGFPIKCDFNQFVNATRDPSIIAKGWELPNIEKKTRIGVPVKDGFRQFVKMTRDPITNATIVSRYRADFFDAVVKALPYSLTYEYIPFTVTDGTYQDKLQQVYFKMNFDAVVGDATITANRSSSVKLSGPYEEFSVFMILPVKDNVRKSSWVFLKPLPLELWMAGFFFFVLIGLAFWVLGHRTNENFQVPPSHRTGSSFWFSFSTMVFAHREKVFGNLTRVGVIACCSFTLFIISQIYIGNMALFQQLQLPASIGSHLIFHTLSELVKNGEHVGYQKGSFVLEFLKSFGFNESKFVAYSSPEECDQLFAKGSRNGGIVAAFDEAPYIELFLARYGYKYTVAGPKLSTAGFGFVFPKDSPSVPDISRAISVSERLMLGKESSSDLESSHGLTSSSFTGLFIIFALALILPVLIFAVMLIYESREVLMPPDWTLSVLSRILYLIRILFNQHDSNSDAFGGLDDRSGISNTEVPGPSSSSSVQTDFVEGQRAASQAQVVLHVELANLNQGTSTATMEITSGNN